MAQSSNRFGLDEVNTQLTAPTSNVQVQGPLDTSLTTSTRSSGIKNFSESLKNLAQQNLANKIHNDTVDAQLAAAYGREQPKGLEPEAIHAFNYAVDLKEFDKLKTVLANHAILEGNDILNNDKLNRKDKLSTYQRSMQANINTALQAFTPSNYHKFAPLIDEEYSKYSLVASTELAKQKKEEESSINAAAIVGNVNISYDATARKFVDQLSGKNTTVEDDDLSPKEFAKLTVDANNYVASKGLSLKNFNAMVKQTLSTGVGADTRETKATVLSAMVSRLLKAADEGDFTVDPKIITNLIDQVKGNPQSPNSTLRTEITGNTEYGKIFKTIEDNYISNLKTLLSDKRTLKTNAVKDADNKIGNELFDNPEKYTLETGLALLKGMSNFKSQNTAEKRWRAMHTDAALNGSTSAAYVTALMGAHKAVLTPNGKKIDEIAFATYTYEHKLKPEAATKLRKALDPESKASKHRTAVLENKSVVLLLKSFTSTTKAYLKNLNIAEVTRLSQGLEPGAPLPNKLIIAALKKKLGLNSPVFNKAANILNAELDFTEQLETLILNNPDKEPIELAREAKQMFDDLFADVVTDQPLGTTATDRDVAILNTHLEQRKLREAASGAVTLTTSGSGAVTLKEVAEKKQTALTIALKESDNAENTRKYLELASKEVELAQKIVLDEAQFKVKTRAERMSIIMEKGGIPTATDSAKRTVAAFETNPDAYLVLRAKALQEKLVLDISKPDPYSTFAYETLPPTKKFVTQEDIDKQLKAQMQRNREAGREVWRIGDWQLTTSDVKKAYGNVKYYLKGFYDIISDTETPEKKAKRLEIEAQATKTTEALKKTTKDIDEQKKLIEGAEEGKGKTTMKFQTYGARGGAFHEEEIGQEEVVEPSIKTKGDLKSFLKKAETDNKILGFSTDPKKGKKQINYGYGIAVTPKLRKRIFQMTRTMKGQGLSNEEINKEISEITLDEAIVEKTKLAKSKFDKNLKQGEITFQNQPKKMKELLTELEYNTINGIGGWPTLVKAAKQGDYDTVVKEMFLDTKKAKFPKGAERRNKLRQDYFGDLGETPTTFKKTEVNVGAKSLPKVQGEVIEEVAEKATNNPKDGIWDFKKDAIRPIKDMARASLNTVPMHLRFVIDYIKDNKLLSGGEQTVVTERHMTPEVVKVLKTAIYNAKKRGSNSVEYIDYPMPKNGIPVHALYEAAGKVTKDQVRAGKDRWSASFGGVMRMIGDSFDPIIAGSGTFGAFGFKEVNGEIIMDDIYDFSKFKGEATTAYSKIRKWISTEQGDKTYKTIARLGKIEKDDII